MPRLRGRRRGRSALLATLALGASVALVVPAAAAPVPPDPTAEVDLAATRPLDLVGIDPVLDAVPVDGSRAISRADDDLGDAVERQNRAVLTWMDTEQKRLQVLGRAGTAQQRAAEAQQRFGERQVDLAQAEALRIRRQQVESVLRSALAVQQVGLRHLAASLFASEPEDRYALLGSLDDFTAADRRDATRDRALALQTARVERARAPWAAARGARRAQQRRVARIDRAVHDAYTELTRAVLERDRSDELLHAAEDAARTARADVDRARARSQEAIVDRRAARLVAPVTGLDMPLVALNAYWRASALAPCAIPWWVIAGIGRVETRHGTAFTSRLTVDGDTTVHIIGIPLDGRPGTIAIHDTDGGRLDDDPVWDRAVGPMQFIPGTWNRWASDDDASKEADPHNVYDAAGAAAKYLCFSRGDLDTDAKIRGAVLAYNRSDAYANQVLSNGARYRDALDLPDVPPLSPHSPDAAGGSGSQPQGG